MTDLLAGGVFGSDRGSDLSELRQLVEDIGKKSFTDKLGVRRLPDTFDEALWNDLSEAGLTRLTAPPDPDAGPVELAVVLQGIARYAGAVPLAESDLLAAWLAQQAGVSTPDGPLAVAYAPRGEVRDNVIKSEVHGVPWARAAAGIVLAVRSGDDLLVGIAEHGELTISDGWNSAGEPREGVAFELSAPRFTAVNRHNVDDYLRRGAWARSVQVLGALDATALLTVAHTRDREQFGRPLSAFQSVQHALAQMAGEIERLRATVALAVTAAAEFGFASSETDFAVSAAKVVAAQVVPVVTATAHQLHGAVGTTIEHPLWLSVTRAQSWVREFGSRRTHAARLAGRLSPQRDPWDLVIGDPPAR